MSKPIKPILLTGVAALVIAGGITVATTSMNVSAGVSEDRVKELIKEYIFENPQDILDSVQQMQAREQEKKAEAQKVAVKEVMKDFKDTGHFGVGGNPKGDVTVIEFFDYNCPACKMMFESLDALIKADDKVKVLFVEYPIFGPQSDENAKIGSAVAHIAPEKYFDFHSGLMRSKGKVDADYAYDVAKNLGIDVAKLKEEVKKEKYADIIAKDRELGAKLQIQGTPAAIIGDSLIGGAVSVDELKNQVKFVREGKKAE